MKFPKRRATRKDGKPTKTPIHFHFEKGCLSNTKCEISELIVPELYGYNTVDILGDGERESGMKFPPKLLSKFNISYRYCAHLVMKYCKISPLVNLTS